MCLWQMLPQTSLYPSVTCRKVADMIIDISPDTRVLIYNAALLSGLILLYLRAYSSGMRAGFSKGPWLASLAILFIALVTGMRLGGLPPSAWTNLMNGEFMSVHHSGFSLMGGMLLFLPVFFLLQRQFKWSMEVMDRIAICIPLVIAIGRLGCLFAGCCSSDACSMPWGVSYGSGTPVFMGQVRLGMLDPASLFSNPVHPFPVYVILVNLAIWGSLIYLRKILTTKGKIALLTLALLFLSRFILEFFRNPVTNHGFGMPVLGLKVAQWILLVIGLITLWKALYYKNSILPEDEEKTISPYPYSWMIILAFAFVLITWNLYTNLEIIILTVVIIPLILHITLSAWKRNVSFPDTMLRWAYLPSLVALVIVMPTDSLPLYMPKSNNKTWVQLGTSFAQNPMSQSFTERSNIQNCEGDSSSIIITHESKIKVINLAGDIGVHMQRNNIEWALGVNGMYTQVTRSAFSGSGLIPEGKYYFRSIGPYVQVDGPWIGGSVGTQFIETNYSGIEPMPDLVLYPSEKLQLLLRLRLGLRHRFYLEYNHHQWANYPVLLGQEHSFFTGFGMNQKDGSGNVHIGVHFPKMAYDRVRMSVGGRIPVFHKTLLIEPELFANEHGFQYALGMRVNIGK